MPHQGNREPHLFDQTGTDQTKLGRDGKFLKKRKGTRSPYKDQLTTETSFHQKEIETAVSADLAQPLKEKVLSQKDIDFEKKVEDLKVQLAHDQRQIEIENMYNKTKVRGKYGLLNKPAMGFPPGTTTTTDGKVLQTRPYLPSLK